MNSSEILKTSARDEEPASPELSQVKKSCDTEKTKEKLKTKSMEEKLKNVENIALEILSVCQSNDAKTAYVAEKMNSFVEPALATVLRNTRQESPMADMRHFMHNTERAMSRMQAEMYEMKMHVYQLQNKMASMSYSSAKNESEEDSKSEASVDSEAREKGPSKRNYIKRATQEESSEIFEDQAHVDEIMRKYQVHSQESDETIQSIKHMLFPDLSNVGFMFSQRLPPTYARVLQENEEEAIQAASKRVEDANKKAECIEEANQKLECMEAKQMPEAEM